MVTVRCTCGMLALYREPVHRKIDQVLDEELNLRAESEVWGLSVP